MTGWKDTVKPWIFMVANTPEWNEALAARHHNQINGQAQLSFEAGEQSKARLIADLQETVNSMLQDNSELTVALEHERQEGRREVVEWVENHAASWPLLLSDKVREWFKKAQQ
jgi:hypothetical protein